MALGVCSRPAGSTSLRGCLKSLHGFLQRYPHAMVIVDFRELRTIVTSSEAALHQLKTLMSGLFKQPLSDRARYGSASRTGQRSADSHRWYAGSSCGSACLRACVGVKGSWGGGSS